jgi:hypothetical protein
MSDFPRVPYINHMAQLQKALDAHVEVHEGIKRHVVAEKAARDDTAKQKRTDKQLREDDHVGAV